MNYRLGEKFAVAAKQKKKPANNINNNIYNIYDNNFTQSNVNKAQIMQLVN